MRHRASGITLERGQVNLFQAVWFLQDRGGESFEGRAFERQDGDDAVGALVPICTVTSRPALDVFHTQVLAFVWTWGEFKPSIWLTLTSV